MLARRDSVARHAIRVSAPWMECCVLLCGLCSGQACSYSLHIGAGTHLLSFNRHGHLQPGVQAWLAVCTLTPDALCTAGLSGRLQPRKLYIALSQQNCVDTCHRPCTLADSASFVRFVRSIQGVRLACWCGTLPQNSMSGQDSAAG